MDTLDPSEGYFRDLDYLHGYYKGMNPLWMRFICLLTGVEPPAPGRFTYLELGFGRGLSLAMHAAANDGQFWGTDVSASHVAEARELACAAGAQATLLDDSFQQLALREDLPRFDYICLHGVWSWISDASRSAVVDLLATRLRVGGLAYVSYNCMPGWAPMVPARELMALHYAAMGRMESPARAVELSMAFAAGVLRAQKGHPGAHPASHKFLDAVQDDGMRHEYIAHEYLNRDWHVPTYARVMADLERAKLGFAGHAQPLHNFDRFRLDARQRGIVDAIADQPLRETTRDFLLDARFRCDVFAKGLRTIAAVEHGERWLDELFVLTTDRAELPGKWPTPLGDLVLDGARMDRVAGVLRQEGLRPKSVREMLDSLPGLRLPELVDTLILLVEASCASPARLPGAAEIARCRSLNRHLVGKARTSADIQYLASPVTAGAIPVARLSLLFLGGWEKGLRSAEDLAGHAANVLVEGGGEQVARIRSAADEFLSRSMPVLQALIVL